MKDNIISLKGDYGEKILSDRLHLASTEEKCYNVMKNINSERHFYDLNIQCWTICRDANIEYKKINTKIEKIDVKTFPPLREYPDSTGINVSCWTEYQQIPELLLIFIDTLNNEIYGNYIYTLKGKEFILKTTKSQNRVCWKISDMLPVNFFFPELNQKLTKEEIINIKKINSVLGLPSELIQLRKELNI